MKFLLHSHFPAGHAYPMQAIAQALVERGHEVVWLTNAGNQARVLATGAKFVATDKVQDEDDPLIKVKDTGIYRHAYHTQKTRLLSQVSDYRSILKDFKTDVLLVDVFPNGAKTLKELGEIPLYATLGVIPMYSSSRSAPLPRSGDGPSASFFSNKIFAWKHFVNQWIHLSLNLRPLLNAQRRKLGLKSIAWGEQYECFHYSPCLHLQASSPTLEFHQILAPESHPKSVSYIGPLVAPVSVSDCHLPEWWNDVVTHPRVIGITQGTFATDPTSLIMPTIRALLKEDNVLLVVITSHKDVLEKAFGNPPHVRITEWLPYHLLLPQVSILITNGGYGSITQALAHKIPLICAGQTEDKIDTAARVAWTGAGIDLKTDSPSSEQVHNAVHEIWDNDSYKKSAWILGNELNRLGGAEKACELLEALGDKLKERK